jgi:hypothetical protein
VLPHAGEVHELEVNALDILFLNDLEDILRGFAIASFHIKSPLS